MCNLQACSTTHSKRQVNFNWSPFWIGSKLETCTIHHSLLFYQYLENKALLNRSQFEPHTKPQKPFRYLIKTWPKAHLLICISSKVKGEDVVRHYGHPVKKKLH